jgi:UDP-galactopyranose mutase
VVRPYGEAGLVRIADTPREFVKAVERALVEDAASRMGVVDAFLSRTSWDRTWGRMSELIEDVVAAARRRAVAPHATAGRAALAATAPSYASGD